MKVTLLSFAAVFFFAGCKKENSLLTNKHQSINKAKVNGAVELRMKFICFGGDTVFTDTLALTLESVLVDGVKKNKVYSFAFSYHVWHYYYYECDSQDLPHLNYLNFTSDECKSVSFKLIK